MAIQVRLEGGPRDGETLEISEETPCFSMTKPMSFTEALYGDAVKNEAEDIYQYVLHRRMPDGVRVYRCFSDWAATICDQTATKHYTQGKFRHKKRRLSV